MLVSGRVIQTTVTPQRLAVVWRKDMEGWRKFWSFHQFSPGFANGALIFTYRQGHLKDLALIFRQNLLIYPASSTRIWKIHSLPQTVGSLGGFFYGKSLTQASTKRVEDDDHHFRPPRNQRWFRDIPRFFGNMVLRNISGKYQTRRCFFKGWGKGSGGLLQKWARQNKYLKMG